MATQSGDRTIIKAGILLKTDWNDYKSPQEFLNALAPALEVAVDAGPAGTPGKDGASAPSVGLTLIASVNIPANATFVGTGIDLSDKFLQIVTGSALPSPGDNFTIGFVSGTTAYLSFGSGLTSVPRAGFVLHVYDVLS